jgi:ATP-dependent helicase/nuclease subunit B
MLNQMLEEIIHQELTAAELPFASIEKQRLFYLCKEWLELEKQRPPFSVVAQETARYVEISGLSLKLTIDRIDQLADGAQLLIDYKTGVTQIQVWFNERLQQPQLPLYALDIDGQNNFSAVAFAQLKTGELRFKGLHSENMESDLPQGVISIDAYKDFTAPKTWSGLLSYWQKILTQLAADFSQGAAAVNPAEFAKTCQQCDLQPLCRIHSRKSL